MGGKPSIVQLLELDVKNPRQREPVMTFEGHTGRVNRTLWGDLNKTLITCGEDSTIRLWDVETGKQIAQANDHKKEVKDITMSGDGTHFISGSLDKTAKLFDTRNLKCLKTYEETRPINAATLSPLMEHVIIGGGQDAMSVTTTSSKAGKFEAVLYHKIFEEQLGSVRGHFGPINCLAYSPDGRSFTSGGEDGYVRIHHFDADYFKLDGGTSVLAALQAAE